MNNFSKSIDKEIKPLFLSLNKLTFSIAHEIVQLNQELVNL